MSGTVVSEADAESPEALELAEQRDVAEPHASRRNRRTRAHSFDRVKQARPEKLDIERVVGRSLLGRRGLDSRREGVDIHKAGAPERRVVRLARRVERPVLPGEAREPLDQKRQQRTTKTTLTKYQRIAGASSLLVVRRARRNPPS